VAGAAAGVVQSTVEAMLMSAAGGSLSASEARISSYEILSLTQLFQTNNPVTLQAAGAITQLSGNGTRAALIGGSVSLTAQTGIGALKLAIDRLATARTTSGSIDLSNDTGLYSSAEELQVISAIADAGSVSIVSQDNLTATLVTGGGSSGNVTLQSIAGDL